MQQNTHDWEIWRSKGLGGSDAAAVLGVCPYKTALQLWEEKTGRVIPDRKTNVAIERGNNLEPIVRAWYELMHQREMPATLVQHETFPFLRASLDGYNKDTQVAIEIKYQGKDAHKMAKKKELRPHHYAQVQHQLLVSGARRVDYISSDGHEHVIVPVEPDVDYCKNLLKALTDFWVFVETDTPPPASDRDFVQIKDREVMQAVNTWKRLKRQLDKYEEEEAAARKILLSKITKPRMVAPGVRIQKVYRKGTIDYSKIDVLKNMDLEAYRKPGSESWMIKLERETV